MKGGVQMEVWKQVRGYDGYYEVSNLGRVRSMDRTIVRSDGVTQKRKSRLCTIRNNDDGYLVVKLNKDAQSKYKFVHRLVYEAFVEDILNGYDVDHLDFNRHNNTPDNLQAIPHLDNVMRTVNAGRNFTSVYDVSGENNPNYGNRKLSEKYRLHPELAKEKQSRKGATNGRSIRVRLISENQPPINFDYIRECACYIKEHMGLKQKTETIALRITELAKTGRPFYGLRIELI